MSFLPNANLPIDVQSELTVDTPCRKCGYNLRGLNVQSRCPECGRAVGLSVYGDLLKFADPQWVRTLGRGGDFILGGIALIVLAVIGGTIAGGAANPKAALATQVLAIAGNLLTLFGSWLITTPDPSGIGEDIYGTSRQIIRITLWFAVVHSIINLATESGVFPPAINTVLVALAIIFDVIGIVGLIAQLQYFAKLAERIPDQKLANRANWLKVSLPSCYLVLILFGGLMLLLGGRVSSSARGSFAAVGCFAAMAGVAVLIMAVLYLFLIEKLTRQFKIQADIAEQGWALNSGDSAAF